MVKVGFAHASNGLCVSQLTRTVWTSGAVLNGQEMMASFMKEEFKEMGEVVEMVLSMSDVAVRGESY